MFWRKSRKPIPAPVTALQPSAVTSLEPDWGHDDQGRKGFQLLRQKWGEVPLTSQHRVLSQDLAQMANEELHSLWSQCWEEQTTGHNFAVRGWYYTLYRDQWQGKRIIDIGSGLGYDAITFAGAGAAEVMCVDLAPSNLEVIRRIATVRGLSNVRILHLEDFGSLVQLDANYDVIWACGSLLNSPFAFTRAECQALLQHLKPGGRWVELAYPRTRWEREGCMSFDRWGEKTDGGAPWMEWKDLDKLLRMLAPRRFEIVLTLEFYNSNFNWFDLLSQDYLAAFDADPTAWFPPPPPPPPEAQRVVALEQTVAALHRAHASTLAARAHEIAVLQAAVNRKVPAPRRAFMTLLRSLATWGQGRGLALLRRRQTNTRTLVSLERRVVHNGALVQGDGPLEVVTPEGPWAYALELPVASETTPQPLMVRVEMTVTRGTIGVLAIGYDEHVLSEDTCDEADGPLVLERLLPVGCRALVIRNHQPEGEKSSVHLRSVWTRPATAREAATLAVH